MSDFESSVSEPHDTMNLDSEPDEDDPETEDIQVNDPPTIEVPSHPFLHLRLKISHSMKQIPRNHTSQLKFQPFKVGLKD